MFGDTVSQNPIRRALISVYDKTGLEELASGLHAAGVEIVSTGSTARTIADAGLPVTPVEDVTGFPECLDGRVKTLHERIKVAERRLLVETVGQMARSGFTIEDRLVRLGRQ